MPSLEMISASDPVRWNFVLGKLYLYDFYHTASYHQVAQLRGEGDPFLFVFTAGQYTVALPLLLRTIVEGLTDATSVYGYAGPVTSHERIPDSVIHEFQKALSEYLCKVGVVSVFSRLHPLVPQAAYLAGLGDCLNLGQTVSIDLTKPLEVQRTAFRRTYKRMLNRLRREGYTVVRDDRGESVEAFASIYGQTMSRVDAPVSYRIDADYVCGLLKAPESYMHLFMCMKGSTPVCGGLFSAMSGIVQYHLGGTADEWLPHAPMKLLLDGVRIWAAESGQRVFHLGGGVGGQEDSLFHFKAGFSKDRHPFAVWRWVVLKESYAGLCRQFDEAHGLSGLGGSPYFFPYYRKDPEFDFKKPPIEIPVPSDDSPKVGESVQHHEL